MAKSALALGDYAATTVVHEEDSRAACLRYIEDNWTDMRPNSLIAEMGG